MLPINLIRLILLETDNPCDYEILSRKWYRALHNNAFWRKFIVKKFGKLSDRGLMYNYYDKWKQLVGRNFDLNKIHTNAFDNLSFVSPKEYFAHTTNLNNYAAEALASVHKYYQSKYANKKIPTYPRIRCFPFGQQIVLHQVPIVLHYNRDYCENRFHQLSILRCRETEAFFVKFIEIEDQLEIVSREHVYSRRIKAPDYNWFNINLGSRSKWKDIFRVLHFTNPSRLSFALTGQFAAETVVPDKFTWTGTVTHLFLTCGQFWITSEKKWGVAIEHLMMLMSYSELPPPWKQKPGIWELASCPCRDCHRARHFEKEKHEIEVEPLDLIIDN